MKKIITLLMAILFSIGNIACAEKLPEKSYGFSRETYPVLYSYLENYLDYLYNIFDVKKIKGKEWHSIEAFVINRDGSISNLTKNTIDKRNDEAFRKMLLKNTAPPLPKELEYDSLGIVISIGKSDIEYRKIYFDGRTKRASLFLNKKK